MIKTKYGNASVDVHGYYTIHSNEKGNRNRKLHRLIFEEAYGKIPEGYIVHHKDGNRTNNSLENLELVSKKEHDLIHGAEKSFMKNSCGYFRVSKKYNSRLTNGFAWRYCYWINGKQTCITSVDLDKLKEKVLAKGLEWIELEGGEESEVCNQ